MTALFENLMTTAKAESGHYSYGFPTFLSASRVWHRLDMSSLGDVKINHAEMKITFPNGSVILFSYPQRLHHLEGLNTTTIHFDEIAKGEDNGRC